MNLNLTIQKFLKKWPDWFRSLLPDRYKRELVRTGSCVRCGSCCRDINLRYQSRWIKDEVEFIDMKGDDQEYLRFQSSGKDHYGHLIFQCRYLLENGSCGDYQNRPDICRSYPTKSLMLSGGTLPPSCGYQISLTIPFDKRLEHAIEKQDK